MRTCKFLCVIAMAFCITVSIMAPAVGAAEQYTLNPDKIMKERRFFDDPRPLPDYIKLFLPSDIYQHYTYDIDKMKALQAEAVGFKSPDVVGKIAPEIKPGKYTYQDKASKPGLKQLMIPFMYEKLFRTSGPPLGATFSQFEVVPTTQQYHCLPNLEATLKNKGKTKVDAQGFMDWRTWESGIPFPEPSGSERHKAMQAIYNWEYQHSGLDAFISPAISVGWDKNFRKLSEYVTIAEGFWLGGRVTDPPFGWYDERAKRMGEYKIAVSPSIAPREVYGNVTLLITTLDPNVPNRLYAYAASLRRVRMLTGTDAQDTAVGSNMTFDDSGGFARKLSPKVFPYEYNIMADREYLVPEPLAPGSTVHITSKDLQIHNLKMVRRPVYVIELISKDSSYIYGRSVLYIDKETFDLYWNESYDQKGLLFRVIFSIFNFDPKTAAKYPGIQPSWDVQVEQTAIAVETPIIPVRHHTRKRYSIGALQRFVK